MGEIWLNFRFLKSYEDNWRSLYMDWMLDEVIDIILICLSVVIVMRLNRKILGRCTLKCSGLNTGCSSCCGRVRHDWGTDWLFFTSPWCLQLTLSWFGKREVCVYVCARVFVCEFECMSNFSRYFQFSIIILPIYSPTSNIKMFFFTLVDIAYLLNFGHFLISEL